MGDIFRALADPTRRAILDELAGKDDQSLFEICARLATAHATTLTRQAVSQHLAVLEESGLVLSRRHGRTKIHRLDTEPLRAITERWPLRESAARAPTQSTEPTLPRHGLVVGGHRGPHPEGVPPWPPAST